MEVCQAANITLIVGLALLSCFGLLGPVAILVFSVLHGIVIVAESPARRVFVYSLCPDPKQHIARVLSIGALGMQSGRLLGALAAGYLMTNDFVSVGIAACALVYIPIWREIRRYPTQQGAQENASSLKKVLVLIKANPTVLWGMLRSALLVATATTFSILLPGYLKEKFQLDWQEVAWVIASQVPGVTLAVWANSRRVAPVKFLSLQVTLTVTSLLVAAAACSSTLLGIMAILPFLGFIQTLASSRNSASIQAAVPAPLQARFVVFPLTIEMLVPCLVALALGALPWEQVGHAMALLAVFTACAQLVAGRLEKTSRLSTERSKSESA